MNDSLPERARRLIAKMRERAKNSPLPDLVLLGDGLDGNGPPCQLRRDHRTGEVLIEPFPEDEDE